MKTGRLRDKVTLSFVILSATPVLLLGAVTLNLLYLSHRQDVSQLELQLLRQKTEEIEKFFSDTMGIIRLQVGFSQTSEIALSDQDFLLENLLLENKSFDEVSFISLSGKETAKKSRETGRKELNDVSGLSYFKSVLDGREFVGDVYQTLSGPFMTIAAPVKNRDGVTIQILSAEVNLSQISRSITGAYLGSSGYVALFDSSGHLIIRGGQGEIIPGISFSSWSRIASLAEGGASFDGLHKYDRYQSPLSSFAVVGAGEKILTTGWILLIEWPLDDADRIVNDVRSQIIQITIISVCAVLLLAFFAANRIVNPIRLLKQGTVAIERGYFENQVHIKTKDELQELGESFNRMAQGLKRLQELKDEFVFIAAHELRAPVTVIKGYVSMIIGGDAGPISGKLQDFLSQVNLANQSLVKLVEDLLEVARSEAGRVEVKVAPTNIVKVAEEIVGEFSALAGQKSIIFSYNPPSKEINVLADQGKLKEILTNLVSNSIKYTIGEGTITISHEEKGKMFVTHIKDTGVGLSEKQQEKLFEKFYRAKQKGTEEVLGTGLGLWIVRELLRKMDGDISVYSKEGEGSTFSFSLPMA